MTAEVMKRTAPAVISRPQETLTSTEQLSLAYMQCTDVYLYQADFSAVAEGLLFERLALFNESVTAAMGLSSAVMDTLVTLGAKWNVPLFFRMDPTPDPKVYKRTVLVADYSPRLVHWMNHKKRILASATSARIFREYFKIRPTTSSNPEVATTALLKLDETTTVHWVSTLLSLKGRHRRYFRLKHLARRSADWKRWLQVIGRTLGPHTGGEVIAEEHLFPAVDDAVSSHEATPSTLRDFVALHVLLQLAPFTSPRLVDALLNDPSREAATTYVANECASAVSRLASGPLTNIVFRGPAGRERQRRALNHLERLGNQTASFLLAANKKRSARGEKMLPSFNLSVVWQTGLDDSLGGNATDLKLRDLDGPFINLYLNSVEALTSSRLQTRPLASLRFTRGAYKGASGGLLSLRNSLADAPTALYESVFVPTTALLEPFLVTDSDSLTLGTLGNFLSRGLWRLILDSAAGSATRDQLLAGVINLCPDDKTARRRDGESSRAAGDLFAAHLPGIAGLQTAYAVHSRGANVTADDSAEFSSAQLFYIGSCFQLCAAPASGDGAAGEDQGRGRGWSGGHVSARSLCNVPLMLSEGFGAAFGCTNVSKMMRLATRSGGCIDPGAWPPRRRIIHA
ncbi:hypothetical protein HPB48_014002 [Haemaphysalis longicornis]|uniref:Uncharacterized protein n=1 Tax=Haemaphysalis longicornis TaxID=44386 RepID=A0A9J6G6C8_HAELO|nr:hypothetical protein HPB48_014002 [Haemaphysalis longicornis]